MEMARKREKMERDRGWFVYFDSRSWRRGKADRAKEGFSEFKSIKHFLYAFIAL